MSANADMIEYWNGPVGERWAALQPVMDKSLEKISEAAIAFAAARVGERVLDVGCGTGTTTYALAKAVGPSGNVTGVDISRPMLAVARTRGTGVNFREADASRHLFHSTHDLLFSRFGVMFFDNPVAAFANMRKALRSRGRFSFVCWRDVKENLWASTPIGAARPLLPPQPPADPHAPGPFAFADSERLKDILTQAGYRDVRIEKLDSVMFMGATVDDAVEQSLRIGPLAFATKEIDDATRDKVREAVRGALAELASPEGVAPAAACWLVGAIA